MNERPVMTTRRPLSLFIVGALAGAPALVSAADPIRPAPLELKYDGIARETKAVALGGTCPIHVVPTRDDRIGER